MGQLGSNDKDVQATGAQGILFQRVWAQIKSGMLYRVGAEPGYHYRCWHDTIGATSAGAGSGWDDTTGTFKPRNTDPTFWTSSPGIADVSSARIWDDSHEGIWGKLVASAAGVPIQALVWNGRAVKGAASANADPADDWTVLVNAPKVLNGGIVPQAVYLSHDKPRPGEISHPDDTCTMDPFNQHKESVSDALSRKRSIPEGQFDPYAEQRKSGRGNAISKAAMRYDQNVGMRQCVRREIHNNDDTAKKGVSFTEGDIEKMNAAQHRTLHGTRFDALEQQECTTLMEDGEDVQVTNHPTILTNAMYAEHVFAYGVDVDLCHFDELLTNQLRRMADWR